MNYWIEKCTVKQMTTRNRTNTDITCCVVYLVKNKDCLSLSWLDKQYAGLDKDSRWNPFGVSLTSRVVKQKWRLKQVLSLTRYNEILPWNVLEKSRKVKTSISAYIATSRPWLLLIRSHHANRNTHTEKKHLYRVFRISRLRMPAQDPLMDVQRKASLDKIPTTIIF